MQSGRACLATAGVFGVFALISISVVLFSGRTDVSEFFDLGTGAGEDPTDSPVDSSASLRERKSDFVDPIAQKEREAQQIMKSRILDAKTPEDLVLLLYQLGREKKVSGLQAEDMQVLLDHQITGEVLLRLTAADLTSAGMQVGTSKNLILLAARSPRLQAGTSGALNRTATSGQVAPWDPNWKLSPLRTPKKRAEFGAVLQAAGARVGVEVGVQRGEWSAVVLQAWRSCTRYYLVDVWAPQEKYLDVANVGLEEQMRRMQAARKATARFSGRTEVELWRMTSQAAARKLPEGALDLAYLDARHDFCAVAEDIATWWPKIRSGGVLAGHDYMTAAAVRRITPQQDWGLCADGSRHEEAVKGAVDAFAKAQGLPVTATQDQWPSWVILKP